MFDVKCQAEVKNLNVRTEVHGDEYVPAVDIKMMLLAVPVDRITSACPDIGKRFYQGDVVAVGEVNPLTVGHKLENLTVTIGDKVLKGCDIKKGMKINLLPEQKANVEIQVQTEHRDNLAVHVMELLRSEVAVKVSERQLDLVNVQES